MMTRVLNITQMCFVLAFCLGLSACNKDDYYEKTFLENPYQDPTADGSATSGEQGGSDAGEGHTHGGVDSGVEGGTNGSATTGSSDNGSTDGSTVGGTTGGTTGSTDGSTVGGTTGGTTGSTDGSTVGGTTGGTTGSTDGSTVGGTTGGTTGATTGGTTVGGTAGGTTTGGTGYIETSETFHQKSSQTKKLDIVWIIDNSGSMDDEQESLGLNFNAFIQDFITKNVDFKMAITTTDARPDYKGLMVPGSEEKLNSTAAQNDPNRFMANFKRMVKVGTSGSGNEKGLEASEGFMQRYASSFLRPDAYLAVVIVSDEEDQSAKTPVFYTDFLKSHKAESGLVKVYTIVDTGLTNSGSGISTGYQRYAQASNNTAGIVANIRDDFYHSLSDMGNSIINLLDSFALSHDPIPGSLKAYINGILTTNYIFDSASRSIKFDENNLPPVGAEIKVTYLK